MWRSRREIRTIILGNWKEKERWGDQKIEEYSIGREKQQEKLENWNEELEEMLIQKFGNNRQKQNKERQHREEYKERRNRGERCKETNGKGKQRGSWANEERKI